MLRPIPSPSKVQLVRATAQANMDSMRERSAAIRAKAGLEGKQLIKLKPLSEERKASIASSKYSRK